MDGSRMNLDVPGGQAAASGIKGIVGDMREVIGRIKGSAANGLAGWNGTASGTFDTSHADWHGTATRLEQALDEIESKLTTGFNGYSDADTDAGRAIGAGAGGGLTLT